MGLNFDFGHSKVPKMPFFGFGTVKTACNVRRKKVKIISLIDYVSLPIVTANFDPGGVFFLF